MCVCVPALTGDSTRGVTVCLCVCVFSHSQETTRGVTVTARCFSWSRLSAVARGANSHTCLPSKSFWWKDMASQTFNSFRLFSQRVEGSRSGKQRYRMFKNTQVGADGSAQVLASLAGWADHPARGGSEGGKQVSSLWSAFCFSKHGGHRDLRNPLLPRLWRSLKSPIWTDGESIRPVPSTPPSSYSPSFPKLLSFSPAHQTTRCRRLRRPDVVTCQARSWSGVGRTVVTGHQALVTDKRDPPSPFTPLFVQLRAPLYSGERHTHVHTYQCNPLINTSQKSNVSVINQRLIGNQLSPVGGVTRFHLVLSILCTKRPRHWESWSNELTIAIKSVA